MGCADLDGIAFLVPVNEAAGAGECCGICRDLHLAPHDVKPAHVHEQRDEEAQRYQQYDREVQRHAAPILGALQPPECE
jgi:hypothetical protein